MVFLSLREFITLVEQKNTTVIVSGADAQIKAILDNTSSKVFFTDPALFQRFHQYDQVELLELSDQLKQEINVSTLRALQQLVQVRVNSKSLGELTTVDGFSSWFYHRYRIYYGMCELQYEAQKLKSHFKRGSNLRIVSSDKRIAELLKDDFEIEFIPSISSTKAAINYSYLFKFACVAGIRFLKGLFKTSSMKKKQVLFLGAHQYYAEIRGTNGSLLTHNYFGKILEETPNNNAGIIDYLRFPKLKGVNPDLPFSKVLQRQPLPSIGSEFVTIAYGLFNLSSRRKVKGRLNTLKTNYSQLLEADTSPLHKLMIQEFVSLHSSTALYLYQFTAFERFFKHAKTKLIVSIDENSANPKSILEGARTHGIKAAGVQHGSIHHLHPSYLFSEEEEPYHPHTDYIFLWGEHFKRLICNDSTYLPENCIVIGQPRMDYSFDMAFNTYNNCSQFLDPNKKHVLFASQPQQDENLRKRAAEDVINACKDIESTELIIKLHPNEKVEYYEEISRNLGVQVTILKNEVNLFFLLKNVDIVITCFSTVGAEAVFFQKPLVVLDHLHQDVMHYISKGVGIPAHNERELKNVLLKELETPTIEFSHYGSYIKDFAYSIDGQVSKRFWKAVLERV